MQKQKIECRYSTFSTTSPTFSLRTLAPNVTQTTAIITPPDDLLTYDFSGSLDNLSDADLFLDDTTTSSFPESSSDFNFSIPPLMHSTSDAGSVTNTTSSLDTSAFSLWAFDPPPSESAPFLTGQGGLDSTTRPTPQTWRHDTTPRDQDHGGAAVNLGPETPITAARRGPEKIPEGQRTNWRIGRDDDQQTSGPGATYDPLLEELAGAMSRGKKDRHLQDSAVTIMRRLMLRSHACCHSTDAKAGEHGDQEKQDVDFTSLPLHEIIDGTAP